MEYCDRICQILQIVLPILALAAVSERSDKRCIRIDEPIPWFGADRRITCRRNGCQRDPPACRSPEPSGRHGPTVSAATTTGYRRQRFRSRIGRRHRPSEGGPGRRRTANFRRNQVRDLRPGGQSRHEYSASLHIGGAWTRRSGVPFEVGSDDERAVPAMGRPFPFPVLVALPDGAGRVDDAAS
jgi:hypothetical protein